MISPHVRVCLCLAALLIPIAIADKLFMVRSGSGWISLDFSGFFIGAYALFLPLHFITSTIAVNLFPKASLWLIHPLSALVGIGLLVGGFYGYIGLRRDGDSERELMEVAKHELLANVITLDHWSFSPNPDSADVISISVTMSESGRFAVGATGRDAGDYGEWYFQSENEGQRSVEKGEHFDYRIPLMRERYGVPKRIEITIYLFADTTGSAGRDVIKVFQSIPTEGYDQKTFYVPLPKPSPFP